MDGWMEGTIECHVILVLNAALTANAMLLIQEARVTRCQSNLNVKTAVANKHELCV